MTYDKMFAAISAHFLTEALPLNWRSFDTKQIEQWFNEHTTEIYEYLRWTDVYSQIAEITDTVIAEYNGVSEKENQ